MKLSRKSAPPVLNPPELPRGRDEEPKPDLASKEQEETVHDLVTKKEVEEPKPDIESKTEAEPGLENQKDKEDTPAQS